MSYDLLSLGNHVFIAAVTLMAILNPFGNLPLFLSMTESLELPTRQKLFRVIVFTAFVIVIIFILTGSLIMEYVFKVDIKDLRMSGGIILVIMGVKNLVFPSLKKAVMHDHGKETEKEIIQEHIIPMAFPMMVGPGTLATLVIISTDSGMLITLLASVICFLTLFLIFQFSVSIEKVLGRLILHVLARIMQVFIVAVGVKIFMTGLLTYLKI